MVPKSTCFIMQKPTVVEMYAGCGGFSLGAKLAGFQIDDAIEIDGTLHSSYSLNFPKSKSTLKDVRTIDSNYWKRSLRGVKPDGVIGGPPCQGFSNIGKKDTNDSRNELLGIFFDNIKILKPKFFVMENVTGLNSGYGRVALDECLEKLAKRYTILGPIVLSAADFGLPTIRKRVFVVGIDEDQMEPMIEDDLRPRLIVSKASVRDAISDLPKVVHAAGRPNDFEWGKYKDGDKTLISDYAALMRKRPNEKLGWEKSKSFVAKGRVSGNRATRHTEVVVDRFKNTKQGETEPVSRYPRLSLAGLCPTLRAGTGTDLGSFQAMRPIHPTSNRVISVREAARLQGFPDWFVFHPTIWHSFRMIGNSVPPLLASELLKRIKKNIL